MENVREFWLENQDGAIWRFTDKEVNTFLNAPKGLGMAVQYGGYRLGNTQVINYQQYDLLDVEGTLFFYRGSRADIYKEYFNFLQFISKNRLLKLHYRTPNSFESYYRYCFVQEVQKTEINNDALIMECPVRFSSQTFWRNDKKNVLVVDNSRQNDGKKYLLKRPYHYASSMLSNMKVINRGNTDTAIKITIEGESINPTINAFDNKGNKYGVMRLLGDFDKVVVDSDDLSENITLIKDESVLTAPYSYQDLSVGAPNQVYVTFIKIKSGESVLRFTSDNIFTGTVTLEWSDEYVSI